ncbi:MAG: 3-deoxy-7-phosphoheptulonate synthase [Candidatus Firestonebacteria bacterium RIFOXYC2_FULL_39_67]|nr:MAG: 3-deoxy-7-phosphoheptulonate synthase [Candidatus Firestonebacteria bacterium RIFOXYD2_FULL_39_29]OGF56356.1 MAG: 3-deoxy-7-phosphoheptulonate synthase [Candidatus Firestonebacteria bacterium RIFOXYC2_FULL_39_67]
MIIVLKPGTPDNELNHVIEKVEKAGLTPHVSKGIERTLIMVIGDDRVLAELPLETMPGVEKVMSVLQPFKLVSKEFQKEPTVIKVRDIEIGGKKLVVMAGPCSVESREALLDVAKKVKEAGATILRGGAFKPRTSPYAFQGMGEEGLKLLSEARDLTGLPIVTEVMDTRTVDLVSRYTDIIQIGARNMQNFELLKEVGECKVPVLLKRGLSSTIKEWLMSAEYIMSRGNYKVMLCERGIRTFEDATRNTLDLSAVAVCKHLSHLPVIVDPSHGTGKWRWAVPMSKAAIAAGCDGLMLEVHPNPEDAMSDGDQSLLPDKFKKLMAELKPIAKVIGREL